LSKCDHVVRRNLCVFLIGKPEPGQSDYVTANIERLKSLGVSVTAELRFVGDSELDEYISRSHLVLTPYTGFTGSSGIIIQAAHFGKPVLSTNDGLLGYLVRKHQLGEAVKVTDSEVFAQWLEQFASTGGVSGFNPPAARAFADSCDPGLYAVAVIR
jgi:glycosyltransferase involved in cell wall biosynthesis